MTRTQKALLELNSLIKSGAEFPDVVGRVAERNKIRFETLTKAYDEQFDAEVDAAFFRNCGI